MPKMPVTFQIKGLNLDNPEEWIADGYVPDMLNMTVEKNVLRKRGGLSTSGVYTSGSVVYGYISGVDPDVMGGYELMRQSTRHTVRVGLKKIQKLNKVTDRWVDITGSDLTGSDTDAISFATPLLSGYPILTITNGVDNVRKYTGTGNTADLGGSPPKCKYLLAFDEYLILAWVDDGNERSSRVQWCDTGDPETWSGGNSGAKDLQSEAEEITGAARFRNYAAIHKENAIYLGYKVASATILKFDHVTVKGTICNNSIQNLPDGTQIYLASDGIRVFNGASSILIKSPVVEELRQSINPEYIARCSSVYVDELDEYWLAVPFGGEEVPETVIKVNVNTHYVYKDKFTNCTALFKYTSEAEYTWDDFEETWDESTVRWNDSSLSNLFQRVMVNDSNGYSYYYDKSVNDDYLTAIDGYFETKDYLASELGKLARWGLAADSASMEIWAKGNTLTVSYSIDSGETWTDIDTLTLSDDYPTDSSPLVLYFDVLSSKIRFRFRNNTLGESFYLKQFVVNSFIEGGARTA